jgi:hypothetical protein
MVENEVLFQQQPWLKRIPHQIRHAVTPVSDALTGTGAGLIAGTALGSPRAGAAIGGILGGLHGVLAHSPTPAQEWAYNNPELVHVLKARAAYDAGDGFEMGKAASWEKLAVSPEWVGARLESLRDSTDPDVRDRLSKLYNRTDAASRRAWSKADQAMEQSPHADATRGQIKQLAAQGEPSAVRYTQGVQNANRLNGINAGPIAGALSRIDNNSYRELTQLQMQREMHASERRHAEQLAADSAARERHYAEQTADRQARAKALLASRAAEPTPPPGASYLQTVAPLTYALEKSEAANAHASEVNQAFIRMGEKMDARAAATPKTPAPATHAPAAAPKSNLKRNLGIGAAAVALPTLAYTAYRHFADKPDAEKAHEAGKTAMLRTLGF